MAVEEYVAKCSLHALEGGQGVMLIPPNYVDVQDLPDFSSRQHYLVYAGLSLEDQAKAEALTKWIERQKSLMGPDFGQFKRQLKERSEALGVRLLSIWKVLYQPEEIFARALGNYGRVGDHRPTFYYRLVKLEPYTVIQYWFFYAYNDFGISHGGANDHEGDWESVLVILEGEKPAWAVYSSHGGPGGDNRRPWEGIEVEGTHPVVYVAAGSHANYFDPGLKPAEKPFTPGEVVAGGQAGIPWADPVSLDRPWFTHYMGRWGLRLGKALEEMGGAPTGPKFNRDGTVRLEWERPLLYAGLA